MGQKLHTNYIDANVLPAKCIYTYC